MRKPLFVFLFFPEKKNDLMALFKFFLKIFLIKSKKILLSVKRTNFYVYFIIYFFSFFLSFMCWVGRGYFYLFMYCDWVGRRMGRGTK